MVGDARWEFVGVMGDDDEGDGGVGAIIFDDAGGTEAVLII